MEFILDKMIYSNIILAESGKRKAESGKRKAESGKRKAESGKRRANSALLFVCEKSKHPIRAYGTIP